MRFNVNKLIIKNISCLCFNFNSFLNKNLKTISSALGRHQKLNLNTLFIRATTKYYNILTNLLIIKLNNE